MSEEVAFLEWLNYEAMQPVAAVTSGLELTLRDDLILTSSSSFPTPDSTHACLLRTKPEQAEALVDEIIEYFTSRELPPAVYISEACSPNDWANRLEGRGFTRAKTPEAWIILDEITNFKFGEQNPAVSLRRVQPEEASLFAATFLEAFDMPTEFTEPLADLMRPSIGLPNLTHYIASVDGNPAGTATILKQGKYGILGSGGVVPAYRRNKVTIAGFHAIFMDCLTDNISTLFGQVVPDGVMDRLLSANGFRRAFVRHAYTLESE